MVIHGPFIWLSVLSTAGYNFLPLTHTHTSSCMVCALARTRGKKGAKTTKLLIKLIIKDLTRRNAIAVLLLHIIVARQHTYKHRNYEI